MSEKTEQWKNKLKSFGIKEWGVLLLVGICCLILILPEESKKETKTSVAGNPVSEGTEQEKEEESYTEELERRLTELLSQVENIGKVQVMITVASGTEKQILQDGTEEREEIAEGDGAGTSRTTKSERTDKTTVFVEGEKNGSPYVVTEYYPEVVGVVVLAQGSGTGSIDFDILTAVQVLFDVPAHKIKIMKMK